MLSSTIPEPLDTPKENCKGRRNARKQPGKLVQGEQARDDKAQEDTQRREPQKHPTTWEQRAFTAACVMEYEKDAVQPYCRHTTRGPSTPANVHQVGPRGCTTGRSAAILTNKALTEKRQSERQLSGGNKVEHYRPLTSTSKPRPPSKTLKLRPACPGCRE